MIDVKAVRELVRRAKIRGDVNMLVALAHDLADALERERADNEKRIKREVLQRRFMNDVRNVLEKVDR